MSDETPANPQPPSQQLTQPSKQEGEMTRHEQKALKRQQREKELEEQREKEEAGQKRKDFLGKARTAVFAVAGLALVYWLFSVFSSASTPKADPNSGTFTPTGAANFQTVHWHSYLVEDSSKPAKALAASQGVVVICGEVKNLPYPPPGQSHLGSGLLHIHNEPEHYIHQEGRLNVSDPSKLGSFFDNIGVKFSSTELWDKKNGDVCENTGLPGKVVFKVNGVESNLYRNAPVFDGDRFEVRFE